MGPGSESAAVQPKLCCGIVNRGLAMSNGMIFAPVIDGRLIALDALDRPSEVGSTAGLSAGLGVNHHGPARGGQ